jgi:SAM-dependent methyltransferase
VDSVLREIRAAIETIANDVDLYEETNFGGRVRALDRLELDVVERIDELLLADGSLESLTGLRQDAGLLMGRLGRVDETLFHRLRQRIASGDYTGAELRQQLLGYAGVDSYNADKDHEGYDSLDALVNGLVLTEDAPEEVRPREPEMVAYQPTPARLVLQMVENADFSQDDVFYDIGSGLGQVAILVHLLSGIRVKGVEVEPAYCGYARRCAEQLNLSQVEFINVDARDADYGDGTVFFLYTPCEGQMLAQVLGRLEAESRMRAIRVCTYGPCTAPVGQQAWLKPMDPDVAQPDRLAVFSASEHWRARDVPSSASTR